MTPAIRASQRSNHKTIITPRGALTPDPRQNGFTLIELMIVVAIIGILAAIAIPNYFSYTIRSQVVEGLNLAAGARTAVAEYYHENGAFPADNSEAALPAAGDIQGKFVVGVSVSDDEISIEYGNDANSLIAGETVILRAVDNTGSVTWVCDSGGVIEDKHLPGACR